MKITFDTFNQNQAVDKVTTTQSTSSAFKGQFAAGVYALDISGTVMDNNAYVDHGRATKDVMQSFEAQVDLDVQRDYMTVMSNILSTEDFNKMMKDGFDPSKVEPEQVVTIVDHIKATMAQSGQVIKGYNDDLDAQKLKEIIGDAGLAKDIEQALKGSNLPVSEENVTALKESLDKASSIHKFDDGSKKYMVENHLEPTIGNVYMASFSAVGDGNNQSKGYYAQEMPGYFARKADNIDWKGMQPQLEKAISAMELPNQPKEESMRQASWLMKKGVPVTQETMNALAKVENISIPLDKNTIIQAGVNALLEGKTAVEGNLTQVKENIYEQAVRFEKEANAITNEAVKKTLAKGEKLTLRNLYASQMQIYAAASMVTHSGNTSSSMEAQISIEVNFSEEKFVTASRQLAEVQLRMTIDANIKLLKSDYSIDTAPLSELVEMLKAQEQKLETQFFGEENSEGVSAKAELFTQTQNTLKEIPFLPAAVIGKIAYTQSSSLNILHIQGKALQSQYEAAGTSYEALMTAPRADMGDSIKKAFRNVDDILQDMNFELTETNRKAVRILGYNSMEITQESINDVKDAYIQVEDIVKSMTPQKVLTMIREGVNPLTMDLNELEQYLNRMDSTPEEEMTKYSRYLYELEKNGQVTQGERDAYIGVYRLLHQIEKSDGAVIGSLLEQGADLTFGNMLTAVRNRKAGKMDYTVDDSFGTISGTVEKGESISGQIEKGVREARMARSVLNDLSVSGLQQAGFHEQMTLEQLKDGLNQTSSEELSEESAKELLRQQKADWNMAAGVDDAVLHMMKEQGIAFTVENILAAKSVLTDKGQLTKVAKNAAGRLDETENESHFKAEIEAAEAEIIDSLTDYDTAQKAMEKWENSISNALQQVVSETSDSTEEVKEMFMGYKQLSVISTMRKAESYEVPMELNGEMTSINLTLRHDSDEKGIVTITTDSQFFGKAGAKFKVSENRIESYFVADSEMGKERLQIVGEKILGRLQQSGMIIGDTHYVNAYSQGRKEWNLLTFSSSDVDNNNDTVATKQLYHIAKTFLKGMRDFT